MNAAETAVLSGSWQTNGLSPLGVKIFFPYTHYLEVAMSNAP